MKLRSKIIILISFFFIFSVTSLLDSGQINPALSKSRVKLTKLPDRYISGIVFENGVSTGITNKYVGIFMDNCKRVYVSLANSVVGGLQLSTPFRKVKIKISGGSFLKLDEASNTQNKIPALSISLLREHTFKGRVTIENCRDQYIEMSYRLCNYGTFTARVLFTSYLPCAQNHLSAGDRVKVTCRDWTFSPENSKFTLSHILNVKKL